MAKQLQKSEIIKGLKSGKYKLIKYIPKPGKSAHVWNTFGPICNCSEKEQPVVRIEDSWHVSIVKQTLFTPRTREEDINHN